MIQGHPDDVQLKAKRIARHFPWIDDVTLADGSLREGSPKLTVPDKQVLKEWAVDSAQGPLIWNTRTA